MRNNVLFILGLLLFDGLAVVWAAWEFWSVRPEAKVDPVAQPPSSDASEEGSRHLER